MDLKELINEKEISESSKKVYLSLLKRMEKAKFKPPMKNLIMLRSMCLHLKTPTPDLIC